MAQAQSSQAPNVSNESGQSVSSIRLMTNSENLYKNLKFIFADSTKVLAELMQNARRAGAHKVAFSMDEQTNALVVVDDGCGIQDFQTLLHNSESGWDEAVKQADRPFGLGFLSCLYAAEKIIIESRGKQCTLIAEKVIAMEPMDVTHSDYIGHTRITLINFNLTLAETKQALEKYARGFSIPVLLNDIPLVRDHAIDQLNSKQTLSIGTAALRSSDIRNSIFYVQGLPIENPLGKSIYVQNVVHLDTTFDVKMPDRHALYDPESQVARIEECMKTGWIEKLHSLKQSLPGSEFVSYYKTLRAYGQLALLNDVPYLPPEIVQCFEEEPTKTSPFKNYGDGIPVISQVDIENNVHTLVYNLDTAISEHQGLSMVIQSLIYENDWFYIEGSPLDQGHWLFQSKAIDLDKASLELVVTPKVTSWFSGEYVYASLEIVDRLVCKINDHEFVMANPSVAVETDDQSNSLTIYLGSTAHPAIALGQASNYENESDDFDESSFDKDVMDLNNLRAQLLGETASASVLKAIYQSGLAKAPNCKDSVSVLTISKQDQLHTASLDSILALFMQHQQVPVDHQAITSFISDVMLVGESTPPSAQLHSLNVWRDVDSSSLDTDI